MIYDDRLVNFLDQKLLDNLNSVFNIKKHRVTTRRETLSTWTYWMLMLLVLYISIVWKLLRWFVFCMCMYVCVYVWMRIIAKQERRNGKSQTIVLIM